MSRSLIVALGVLVVLGGVWFLVDTSPYTEKSEDVSEAYQAFLEADFNKAAKISIAKGEGKVFGSFDEVLLAYHEGLVDTQSAIKVRYSGQYIDLQSQYHSQDVVHADVEEVQGELIEVQGTAEGEPFSRDLLDTMLDYAEKGIAELVAIQNGVRA